MTRLVLRLAAEWAAGNVLRERNLATDQLAPGELFYVAQAGEAAVRVRAYPVDESAARRHLAALPELVAPVLEGDDEPDLLADVAAVIGGRGGVRVADLADALGRDVDELREELRAVGVNPSATYRPGPGESPVRGVSRVSVEEAIEARDGA